MRLKRLVMAVALMSLCFLASPPSVLAAGLLEDVCQGEQAQSATCVGRTDKDPIGGTSGLIANVTTIMAIIAGIAAVIVLIVGAINLITSGGDSNKTASARKMVINALIGIAVIVLAKVLITFVISRI